MTSRPLPAASLLFPIALTIAAAAADAQSPITAFGLPHEPIGNATLNLTGNKLVVSNLGSSGLDGVRVHVDADGWDGFVIPPPVQPGDSVECTALAGSPTVPTAAVAGLRMENQGGTYVLSAGVESATSYTIEAYVGRELVYRKTGHQSSTDLPYVVIGNPIAWPSDWHHEIDDWGNLSSDTTYLSPVSIAIEGGPTITCDLLRVRPENVALPNLSLEYVEMRATVPFEIEGERLVALEHSFGAIGQAEIETTAAGVRVYNLGSSGQDGIAVFARIAEQQAGIDVHWGNLPPPSVAAFGAGLDIGGTAHLASGGTTDLGHLFVTSATPEVLLSCDHQSLGATGYRFDGYSGGVLVGSIAGPVNSAVTCAAWPNYACVLNPQCGDLCTYSCWGIPESLTVQGPSGTLGNLTCSELRIVPLGVNSSIAAIESVTVRSNLQAQLDIVGATALNDPNVVAIGTSCPTSSGFMPQHRAVTAPQIGTLWQGELTNLQPETSLALVAIGVQRIDPGLPLELLGMPGCTQHVVPLVMLAIPTGGASSVSYSVPLPNDPTLVGLQLFTQGLVNGAANALQLASTNAIGLTLMQ